MIALVLAAGRGQRMGGPKALLPWEGTSLVCAHGRAARDAGCARVFAVVRAPVAETLGETAGLDLVISVEDDALGPAGSLRAAVQARAEILVEREVAIANVDTSPAAWAALGAMRAALDADPNALAARPRHQGRGGHPVLVRGALLAVFDGDAIPTLRDVLARNAARVLDVEVEIHAVRSDMDTPEDIARWRPGSARG